MPLLQDIGPLLPNLDCFVSPDEAEQQRKEFLALIPVFKALANYCEAKSEAMKHRLAGRIELANKICAYAEEIYSKLPPEAKW